MADKKISDLVELTTLAADDVLPVVDADANATKRVKYQTLSAEVRDDVTPADFTLTSGDLPVGSIVQVVNGVTETSVFHTSFSYVDTGLSATITPQSSSNKIFVLFNLATVTISNDDESGLGLRLLRDGSLIWNLDASNAFAQFVRAAGAGVTETVVGGSISGNYLDTPNTTSSLTYKCVSRREGQGSSSVEHQPDGETSSMTLFEVVA